jgi:hypothetical protein
MKYGVRSLLAHRLGRNSQVSESSTIACLSFLEQEDIGDDARMAVA